jgi:signal transduction histidine kinase
MSREFGSIDPLPNKGYERFLALETRIRDKIQSFEEYGFDQEQHLALTVFFDLAQEYQSLRDLYNLAVIIPRIFFGLESCLYTIGRELKMIRRRCSWTEAPAQRIWDGPRERLRRGPFFLAQDFIVPVRCNTQYKQQLPVPPEDDVIGLLVLRCPSPLTRHERLFFEKFGNRVGYQLHNKLITLKNRQHLSFIRSLARDIGHNVIVPNMYFKLLFKQVERIIEAMGRNIDTLAESAPPDALGEELNSLHDLHEELGRQQQKINRHYEFTSLFLESLLRRGHFEKGHYVLQKRTCNFRTQVIIPQLERYRDQLLQKGITIDTSLGGIPDREVLLVADLGLISQVFANLFSNAVKYTREVRDEFGRRHKFMAYGWEIIPRDSEHFSTAVKLNVFTTGSHIPAKERSYLFRTNFRSSQAREEEIGTGHGLFFVKQIVELHEGEVGYEPTYLGNNFYIILPCEVQWSPKK